MAGFFTGTVKLMAEGRRPHAAILFDHDFPAGHRYNWTGFNNLVLDGHTWIGSGEVLEYSQITVGGDDAVDMFRIRVSGVKEEFIEAALDDAIEMRGRSQQVWLQVFDPDTYVPVDPKLMLLNNLVDLVLFTGVGSSERNIEWTSEPIWTGKDLIEHAYFSDRDQQALFPGDLGFEFTAELVPGKRDKWPDFTETG